MEYCVDHYVSLCVDRCVHHCADVCVDLKVEYRVELISALTFRVGHCVDYRVTIVFTTASTFALHNVLTFVLTSAWILT